MHHGQCVVITDRLLGCTSHPRHDFPNGGLLQGRYCFGPSLCKTCKNCGYCASSRTLLGILTYVQHKRQRDGIESTASLVGMQWGNRRADLLVDTTSATNTNFSNPGLSRDMH